MSLVLFYPLLHHVLLIRSSVSIQDSMPGILMPQRENRVDFTIRWRDAYGNENVIKKNRLRRQNNNFARVSKFFVQFFA